EGKVGELEAANNDLENLLVSTNVPTVFLDRHLCIRRFTPSATQLFKLIASDVGRPLGDVVQRFADPALSADTTTVLDQLVPLHTEIRTDEGRWYMRQVLPYRTQDSRIEGVVVTFSDVAAAALQDARMYAESIVDTAADGIITIDDRGTILSFN